MQLSSQLLPAAREDSGFPLGSVVMHQIAVPTTALDSLFAGWDARVAHEALQTPVNSTAI